MLTLIFLLIKGLWGHRWTSVVIKGLSMPDSCWFKERCLCRRMSVVRVMLQDNYSYACFHAELVWGVFCFPSGFKSVHFAMSGCSSVVLWDSYWLLTSAPKIHWLCPTTPALVLTTSDACFFFFFFYMYVLKCNRPTKMGFLGFLSFILFSETWRVRSTACLHQTFFTLWLHVECRQEGCCGRPLLVERNLDIFHHFP